MQGTYEVNEKNKTVELVPLDTVINNIPLASDWSTKIDESTEPEIVVQFEGYGRNNLCKWKEHDQKANVGYADGIITSPASPARKKPPYLNYHLWPALNRVASLVDTATRYRY